MADGDQAVIPESPSDQGGGRLGRHLNHDPRSRGYNVAELLNQRALDASHRRTRAWPRMIWPLDQGQLGSCTGEAIAGVVSTGDADGSSDTRRLSQTDAVHIYSVATTLFDAIQGSYPPDDTGSTGLAACKAAQKLGFASQYRWSFTWDDTLTFLGTLGAVAVGTNWYDGQDRPDADGYIHVTGSIRGGHEYEICGVNFERNRVLMANSWGDWGPLHGFAYLSFDDLQRLLAEQGDVVAIL